ncbi:hypothetical protein A2U01_0001197 [Trifolium medium]|uniref:Uncharacterized protein n=1 Tax=Trifolium medium TaxID=97028 RepID=A0A392LZK3_9FABA|nr:hypothetical protein [Trifolium medium]
MGVTIGSNIDRVSIGIERNFVVYWPLWWEVGWGLKQGSKLGEECFTRWSSCEGGCGRMGGSGVISWR